MILFNFYFIINNLALPTHFPLSVRHLGMKSTKSTESTCRDSKELFQQHAVIGIRKKFGQEFLYTNANGNLAINKKGSERVWKAHRRKRRLGGRCVSTGASGRVGNGWAGDRPIDWTGQLLPISLKSHRRAQLANHRLQSGTGFGGEPTCQ
jgi:hypothetical protein